MNRRKLLLSSFIASVGSMYSSPTLAQGATPTANLAAQDVGSSPDNPIPFGQSAEVGDFQVQVYGLFPERLPPLADTGKPVRDPLENMVFAELAYLVQNVGQNLVDPLEALHFLAVTPEHAGYKPFVLNGKAMLWAASVILLPGASWGYTIPFEVNHKIAPQLIGCVYLDTIESAVFFDMGRPKP